MTNVFLICTGLGRINRGYESFTRECFDVLSEVPELDVTLFKGAGPAGNKQIPLWNLPRTHPFTVWLGARSKTSGRGAYLIEQATFLLSLLPHVARRQPDVIYFSDVGLGKMLWHWRRLTRGKFNLLFSNGGPMPPPYPQWDFVQQLAPVHLETALEAGQDASKQSLLPYGICMEPALKALSAEERAGLRRSLDLPPDRPIVLSVGLVNKSHKRMDYVIREVAALPAPRPFLVILGQPDAETPEVQALAETLLGTENYQIRTVPYPQVASYYQVSDAFVLASRLEGFGRVYLEALSWGLPCLAHDSALTRYVVGSAGLLADFDQPGALAALLVQALAENYDLDARRQRHRSTFERFSWQTLRPQYVAMIQKCAQL